MAPVYTVTVRNSRLQQVQNAIDAQATPGQLQLLSGSASLLASFTFQKPSATIASGVLTFSGLPLFATASGSGTAAGAQLVDGSGNIVATGLVIGVDFTVAPSASISAGQLLELFLAQITGN